MEANTHAIAIEIMDTVKTVGNVTFDGNAKEVLEEIEAILNAYL